MELVTGYRWDSTTLFPTSKRGRSARWHFRHRRCVISARKEGSGIHGTETPRIPRGAAGRWIGAEWGNLLVCKMFNSDSAT